MRRTLAYERRAAALEECDHAVFLFDIDDTLTPPRLPLTEPMAETLMRLATPFHIDGGSDLAIVKEQFLDPFHGFGYRGVFDAFLSNGANRYRCHFGADLLIEPLREYKLAEALGEGGHAELLSTITGLLASETFRLPDEVPIIGERIIDRGSMINVAPGGRPTGALTPEARTAREQFVAFDEATAYRKRFLGALREATRSLQERCELELCLGGKTSFDIGIRGNDKRYALAVLLAEGAESITYFGDALFDGGNDEPILHFIRDWSDGPCPVTAVPVDGWEDTAARLQAYLRA